MTEDYKKQVLDYITGNISEETGVNEPIFNTKNIDTNFYEFRKKILNETNYQTLDILGLLEFSNTDKRIIYGNLGRSHQTDYIGIVIILDEKNQVVDYITQFSSGTSFNQFVLLSVDENNLIYGIDITSENKYRFIMLNDIISTYLLYNEYKCILRKSYLFPNAYNNIFNITFTKIYKEYEGAGYIFIGQITSNHYITIIKLDINVGEENEWNQYTSNYAISLIMESFINWQSDTLSLKIGSQSYDTNNYYEFTFDGTNLTRMKNINCPGIYGIIMTSPNNIYIIQTLFTQTNSYYTANINYYKLENTTLNLISSQEESAIQQYVSVSSYNINEFVYFIIGIPFVETSKYNIGIILNETLYEITTTAGRFSPIMIYATNKYNLYNFCVLGTAFSTTGSYIIKTQTDYNSNNYNGESYLNYNSLIAHKGTLYDENELVFSRNLYNKTILNNSTTSTIQVPNTMLNDTNILNKNLVGETNLTLVKDNDSLTKNIYETLFINFINKLNVIDEDTTITYPISANYVNTNINVETKTNYNNSYISKVRLNKTTPEIQNIIWTSIDDTHLYTEFTIYVDSIISTIDFISDDETTIYLTKDLSELEIGKTYTITQYIRME